MTFELGARDRKALSARLTGGRAGRPVAVRTADGEIELPAPARRAVEQLLTELAAGHTVRVLADDHDLTTQEVAELLGLSRTFVVRLIDEGKIPAHLAGTHRRVRTADALAYERHRRARITAVEQITTADAEVGVVYR
jgi:excisionase family DNA binding protein